MKQATIITILCAGIAMCAITIGFVLMDAGLCFTASGVDYNGANSGAGDPFKIMVGDC